MTAIDSSAVSLLTGILDHDLCDLTILGSDFKGTGTFELEVTVSKGNRSAKASLQIEKMDYDPPILKMA